MAVIALDLGGTKVAGAVVDSDGRVIFKHRNLLNGATGEEVGRIIVENMRRLIQKCGKKVKIEAVGICIPGIVDYARGRVWAPNIPGWEDFPLRKVVREGLDGMVADVCIDNDRVCYVYGEKWLGAAKGCDNVVFVAVGTGIGAGIVIDNHALKGANNITGATGWMALEPPYDTKYDQVGCFEYYASGTGIAARAREAVHADKRYRGLLRQKPISRISTPDVFAAYGENDPIATAVLDKAIEMWGMASANLVSLLNPQMIVWGGGVFGPGAQFIDRIYAEACKWAQPISIRTTKFMATVLPGNAGLMGAAYIALNRNHIYAS